MSVCFLWVRWFPPPIKTSRLDITKILLKVALNTITHDPIIIISILLKQTWKSVLLHLPNGLGKLVLYFLKKKFKKDELWANAHLWYPRRCFPQYGVHIWRLLPNIRFLPPIVAEKNATKNILGRTEGRTEVKQYTPGAAGGIIIWFSKLSNLSVPDEGYSRNASCALN